MKTSNRVRKQHSGLRLQLTSKETECSTQICLSCCSFILFIDWILKEIIPQVFLFSLYPCGYYYKMQSWHCSFPSTYVLFVTFYFVIISNFQTSCKNCVRNSLILFHKFTNCLYFVLFDLSLSRYVFIYICVFF